MNLPALTENLVGTPCVQTEMASALCQTTLQDLRELGLGIGDSLFLLKLLHTFENDAAGHLALLRSSIAGGHQGQLRTEAHALKGASLTIGAPGMAQICQELENLGTAQSVAGAPEVLARLDREFERVQKEIELET